MVGNTPAYLARIDVHSAAASTALRALVPGLSAVAGFHPQRPLSADAHHLVRAQARAQLTWQQRTDARRAALDAAAAAASSPSTNAPDPRSVAATDWQELRATDHGVEVIGYWGEAVSSAAQARDLLAATGANGLAGDLFVDERWARTLLVVRALRRQPDTCGNCYLDPATVTEHLMACTEADVTAGFHVIGDAAVSAVVDALEQVVARFGDPPWRAAGTASNTWRWSRPSRPPNSASGVSPPACSPHFDALWGGTTGMYARRLGIGRAAQLNPLALLASAGVPMAFGSDAPVTSMNPWAMVRAAGHHQTQGSAISMRAAFAAATRGAWRAGGVRDGHHRNPRGRRTRVVRGVGCRVGRRRRPRRQCAALVDRSALAGAGTAESRAVRSAAALSADRASRRRAVWLRPIPVASGPSPRWRPDVRLLAAATAGLAMCISFPPIGWWWSAVLSFVLLTWVLVHPRPPSRAASATACSSGWRSTSRCCHGSAGWWGRSRGLPWRRCRPCSARCSACSPSWSAPCPLAVVVRAGVVVAGMAQIQCALRWIPLGCRRFRSNAGAVPAAGAVGRVPLLSFGIALVGTSLCALGIEIARWWQHSGPDKKPGHPSPAAVLVPGLCITAVLLTTAVAAPQIRRAGAGNDPRSPSRDPGQCAAPRAGVQRAAPRGARQPRPRDPTTGRRRARRPGPTAAVRGVAGELLRHRPADQPDAAQQISVAVAAIGAPILVGTVLARPDWTPQNPTASNTVVVWDPVSGPGERHDKQIIQPFGEYLPWRGFFKHLSSYADRAGYFVPGTGDGVVHAAGVPIGVGDLLGGHLRPRPARVGAQRRAGPDGAHQQRHLRPEHERAAARVRRARAVEHDRYVVVAGTTGISAVIARTAARSPVPSSSPRRTSTSRSAQDDETPATRWGRWCSGCWSEQRLP